MSSWNKRLCGKKKATVFAVRFQSIIAAGCKSKNDVDKLNNLWEEACNSFSQNQILDYDDDTGRNPFHLAAEYG